MPPSSHPAAAQSRLTGLRPPPGNTLICCRRSKAAEPRCRPANTSVRCQPARLPAYRPVRLPACPPACLLVCLPACSPAHLTGLSACPPARLPACLPACLLACPPTGLSTCRLPAYRPARLPARPPANTPWLHTARRRPAANVLGAFGASAIRRLLAEPVSDEVKRAPPPLLLLLLATH